MFTGHRVKKLIKSAEAQLGAELSAAAGDDETPDLDLEQVQEWIAEFEAVEFDEARLSEAEHAVLAAFSGRAVGARRNWAV